MMMREQQWDRSNCRHFRIDVCLHQRIYMRAYVNARCHYVQFLEQLIWFPTHYSPSVDAETIMGSV